MRVGSAPVTRETAARTAPPWQTTSHVPPARTSSSTAPPTRRAPPPAAPAGADHGPRAAGAHQLVDRASPPRGELRPGLAARRVQRPAAPRRPRLVRELGDRPPGPLAEVDLAPARVAHRVGVAEQGRGLARAHEVARDHALEARQARPQLFGLLAPDVGKRWIGLPLQAPLGVVGRLAVAYEDEAGG